jgi:hypothetical protein
MIQTPRGPGSNDQKSQLAASVPDVVAGSPRAAIYWFGQCAAVASDRAGTAAIRSTAANEETHPNEGRGRKGRDHWRVFYPADQRALRPWVQSRTIGPESKRWCHGRVRRRVFAFPSRLFQDPADLS